MVDLKSFRKANNLTQSDIANYLGGGVEKSFISQIEHGGRKLPDAQLAKLLHNTKGWDTSMLVVDNPSPSIMTHASGNSNASVQINSNNNNRSDSAKKDLELAEYRLQVVSLQKEVERLTNLLEEEKQRTAQYWEMIQKLMK